MPPSLDKQIPLGKAEDWLEVEAFDRSKLQVITLPVKRVPHREDLLVAFTADGRPRALSMCCPHRGVRLDEYARHGEFAGTIVCSAHSCVYDVQTGSCLNAGDFSEAIAALKTWPLLKDEEGVWTIAQEGFES